MQIYLKGEGVLKVFFLFSFLCLWCANFWLTDRVCHLVWLDLNCNFSNFSTKDSTEWHLFPGKGQKKRRVWLYGSGFLRRKITSLSFLDLALDAVVIVLITWYTKHSVCNEVLFKRLKSRDLPPDEKQRRNFLIFGINNWDEPNYACIKIIFLFLLVPL